MYCSMSLMYSENKRYSFAGVTDQGRVLSPRNKVYNLRTQIKYEWNSDTSLLVHKSKFKNEIKRVFLYCFE